MTLPACNPAVAAMHAYVPGEQPQGGGWIKLNTNEFPYPPAPAVLEAVGSLMANPGAGPDAVRKYPDPFAAPLRSAIASHVGHGLQPQNILVGNGSDEILRILFHAFLDPASSDASRRTVAILNPTYSLYDTLAAMFNGRIEAHQALESEGDVLPDRLLRSDAAIAIVANPNPPLGTLYPHTQLRRLLDARAGRLTVIDEAYINFADGSTTLSLLADYPHLAISRTMSKGMALAGLRVGWVMAAPTIVDFLDRIRDSYNVNALSQTAALAAVQAAEYYDALARRIKATRAATAARLAAMGFEVAPSSGNFLFARHPQARQFLAALRTEKILVRFFDKPGLDNGLRITIGTEEEMDRLLSALTRLADLAL